MWRGISNDDTDEIEESSSVISSVGVVSTVTNPSLNNSGKSWNVPAENGLSQKSSKQPGGGCAGLSNQVDEVEEQGSTVKLLALDMLESLSESYLKSRAGGSKRESSDETVLSPSGVEESVIRSDGCSMR